MIYRKFKATHLFTGHEMLDNESVLVTKDDYTIEGIIPAAEGGDDMETLKGILCPGFINCHCHLELSHLKAAIPEKTGITDFLLSVIRQRNYSSDIIQQAIAGAEQEMLRNGIIAVGDICNTADTIGQKKAGRLYYHNFIEAAGFIESAAAQRFESSYANFRQFSLHHTAPFESNSIVPHAPYSVSDKLFTLITGFPGNHLFSIHNQESETENEFFKTGGGDFLRLYKELGIDISFFTPPGKRSLETYLQHFHNNQALILVHNVATSEEDLQFAANRQHPAAKLFFCLCPNANQYISGLLPDVDLLIKHNCTITMGTDSLASNHQLDILEELKTLQQHFPHLETRDLLKWATINGAQALQLDNVLGSFDPGKQPGVVLIENASPGKIAADAIPRRIA